jgi:ribbon-helix-helix CopG family protein
MTSAARTRWVVSAVVDEATFDGVRRLADERGVSVGDVVRQALLRELLAGGEQKRRSQHGRPRGRRRRWRMQRRGWPQ